MIIKFIFCDKYEILEEAKVDCLLSASFFLQ